MEDALEPSVPSFHPTAEEWADFPSFVRKIVPEIEDFGGCTIHPPAGWSWRPPPLDHEQMIKPIRQHFFKSGTLKGGAYTGFFEECPPLTLGDYKEQCAESFVRGQAGPEQDPAELRSQFWRRVVTGQQGVLYGADTDASLFAPSESFAALLPAGTEGDLLRHWPQQIPGLNKPMLYYGGWRSTFCLHTEDSELSGISFLHRGAPKIWHVIPPEFAERVRELAAVLYPTEHRQCAQFLRHKATLIAPATFRAHGIPVSTACQTEGTFVLVLSSAFHFGFNAGFNVAEAVNFALKEWVPHGRRAVACNCGDGQSPHVGVPALMRAVRAAEPDAAEWWCFECACGEATGATNLDDDDAQPAGGEQFECSGCGSWGHVACYPKYAEAAEASAAAQGEGGELPDEMFCVRCVDAWRDRTARTQERPWRFSCVCGRNDGATAESFEAPSGRQFECSGCGLWAHTECFAEYKGVDDDDLPQRMRCHRCRPSSAAAKTSGSAKRPAAAARRSPASPKSAAPSASRACESPQAGCKRCVVAEPQTVAGGKRRVGKARI